MGFFLTSAITVIIGSIMIWRLNRGKEQVFDDGGSSDADLTNDMSVSAAAEEAMFSSSGRFADGTKITQMQEGNSTATKLEENTPPKLEEPQPSIEVERLPDSTQQDDFRQIRGIGPVYAKRLHEAGIDTFGELAKLTSQQIIEIVAPGKSENSVNSAQWIAQAEEMSLSAI